MCGGGGKSSSRDPYDFGEPPQEESSNTSTSDVTSDTVEPREYIQFGTGACRGNSATHNPDNWYFTRDAAVASLELCQALCDREPKGCPAVEYRAKDERCEIWLREPQATEGDASTGLQCYKTASLHSPPSSFAAPSSSANSLQIFLILLGGLSAAPAGLYNSDPAAHVP